MRKKWKEKYPLEAELEKLLKEFRVLVRDFRDMLFSKPKKKMDKIIHLLETALWLGFVLALVSMMTRG